MIRSALTRTLICERLRWLGVVLDAKANEADARIISNDSSAVIVQVIPTNEECVVAGEVRTHLPHQN